VRFLTIIFSVALVSSSALAADYRDAPYLHRRVAYAPVAMNTGIRPAPPLYYVSAPAHYVRDTRFGAPGEWVVPQPGLMEQLFGTLRGYD
jgi:hypothetical protein